MAERRGNAGHDAYMISRNSTDDSTDSATDSAWDPRSNDAATDNSIDSTADPTWNPRPNDTAWSTKKPKVSADDRSGKAAKKVHFDDTAVITRKNHITQRSRRPHAQRERKIHAQADSLAKKKPISRSNTDFKIFKAEKQRHGPPSKTLFGADRFWECHRCGCAKIAYHFDAHMRDDLRCPTPRCGHTCCDDCIIDSIGEDQPTGGTKDVLQQMRTELRDG